MQMEKCGILVDILDESVIAAICCQVFLCSKLIQQCVVM